jgi:hypothetical protein
MIARNLFDSGRRMPIISTLTTWRRQNRLIGEFAHIDILVFIDDGFRQGEPRKKHQLHGPCVGITIFLGRLQPRSFALMPPTNIVPQILLLRCSPDVAGAHRSFSIYRPQPAIADPGEFVCICDVNISLASHTRGALTPISCPVQHEIRLSMSLEYTGRQDLVNETGTLPYQN